MSAAILARHRFGDPVSIPNSDIHDTVRMLVTTVEMLDRMGIEVVSVVADRSRNQRVLVNYSRECDALEGVECQRGPDWSYWTTNRFGIEIRWMRPAREVA